MRHQLWRKVQTNGIAIVLGTGNGFKTLLTARAGNILDNELKPRVILFGQFG